MLKACKYSICSHIVRRQELVPHVGCARWVHNWAWPIAKNHCEQTKKEFSQKEVNSGSLFSALLDLHRTYQNFWKQRAEYLKLHRKQYREIAESSPYVKLNTQIERLHLPRIKSKQHRSLQGKIKTIMLPKMTSEAYYTSILGQSNATIHLLGPVKTEKTRPKAQSIDHKPRQEALQLAKVVI